MFQLLEEENCLRAVFRVRQYSVCTVYREWKQQAPVWIANLKQIPFMGDDRIVVKLLGQRQWGVFCLIVFEKLNQSLFAPSQVRLLALEQRKAQSSIGQNSK